MTKMKARTWAIDDVCWTGLEGEEGLHRGVIRNSFFLAGLTKEFYIIQMDRRDWMTLVIRDATLLARAEGELPPYTKVSK